MTAFYIIITHPFSPHNLPNPHYPLLCTTTLASLVKGRWIDGKPQTVALLRFACDISAFLIYQTFCRQDGGIASLPSLACTNPPNTALSHAKYHILASLVKGEVLSPEKIRATTGGIVAPPTLPKPHYPSRFPYCNRLYALICFHIHTILFAFRRVRVCVCLYGFASVQNLGHTR